MFRILALTVFVSSVLVHAQEGKKATSQKLVSTNPGISRSRYFVFVIQSRWSCYVILGLELRIMMFFKMLDFRLKLQLHILMIIV
jgi:hypothetical protein